MKGKVCQESLMNEKSVAYELLSDAGVWSRASNRERERLARAVLKGLGEEYSFLDLKKFQCKGRSFELARYLHRATGLRLHLIPGGAYERGSRTTSWTFDKPVKEVRVGPFLIGQTPVTQDAWDRIGGDDERTWIGARRPIEKVTVEQVKRWLAKAGGGLRLPSETQWEYAARAGADTDYFWGSEMDPNFLWFHGNSHGQTHDVDAHMEFPNAFGLVDVLGNVWEWCEDDFLTDYSAARLDSEPYKYAAAAPCHVYRGGGWNGRERNVVVSNRNGRGVHYGFSMVGFRVFVSLDLTAPI
jgi:formylglycine-generating enzyme required for sulfatase activity